jgi:long-chain acyl-CoA synthetase
MDLQGLYERAEKAGSKKLLEGSVNLTYRELHQRLKQLDAFFRSWGLNPGDRIGLATTNELEACMLILSCFRLGMPVALIDPGAKKSETQQIIERLQLQAIFADAELLQTWEVSVPHQWAVVRKKGPLASRLLKKDTGENRSRNYPACLDSVNASAEVLPDIIPLDSIILLLCTSGTTGLPKILQLSAMNLLAAANTTSKQLGLNSEERMLNLLPLTHYDGVITGLFTAFYNLGTLVRLGSFTISLLPDILDAIYKYRATHLLLTPSILSLILRLGEDIRESFQTEDFQFVISVASTLPPKIWSDFQEFTGKKVINVYGLSESGNNLFAGPDDDSYQIGSIGVPVDCRAVILSEDGEKVNPGETGELHLAGSSITSGYLSEKIVTRAHDGVNWFSTGDLVYRDENGVYWLVGRKKNIIIVGGRNVYPDEIANVLLTHPAVMEAAILGMADEIWGEKVVSCVVLEQPVSAPELMEFAANHLSDYKVPREIHIRKELPKGRSGKVLLSELIAQLQNNDISTPDASHAGLENLVIKLASESFRTPLAQLSLRTAPVSCSRWDSVAHMDFITNLETSFGIELLPREVIQITSLEAAVRVVRGKLSVSQ